MIRLKIYRKLWFLWVPIFTADVSDWSYFHSIFARLSGNANEFRVFPPSPGQDVLIDYPQFGCRIRAKSLEPVSRVKLVRPVYFDPAEGDRE